MITHEVMTWYDTSWHDAFHIKKHSGFLESKSSNTNSCHHHLVFMLCSLFATNFNKARDENIKKKLISVTSYWRGPWHHDGGVRRGCWWYWLCQIFQEQRWDQSNLHSFVFKRVYLKEVCEGQVNSCVYGPLNTIGMYSHGGVTILMDLSWKTTMMAGEPAPSKSPVMIS